MSPETFLPTLAEIAITIAGFTALIVTVRRQRKGMWDAQELFRVLGVIVICLVTILCTALPFMLGPLPINAHYIWAVPLLLSSFTVFGLVFVMFRIVRKTGFVFIARIVTWPAILIIFAISVIATLCAFGIFTEYAATILVLQLTSNLVLASITLVATLAIAIQNETSEIQKN